MQYCNFVWRRMACSALVGLGIAVLSLAVFRPSLLKAADDSRSKPEQSIVAGKPTAVVLEPKKVELKGHRAQQQLLDQHYKQVARAWFQGKVVPFLGAGANLCGRPPDLAWDPQQQTYLPSGGELAQYLAHSSCSRPPIPRRSRANATVSCFVCSWAAACGARSWPSSTAPISPSARDVG